MEKKKRILYYQCFSGISGDMNLAALIDLGLPEEVLLQDLEKLRLTNVKVHIRKEELHSLRGTRVDVEVKHSTHAARRLAEIHEVIDEAGLEPGVTAMAKKIFRILAEAEGKVHGKAPEKIHFHEVGGEDALIDIVGAAIALHYLNVDEVWASTVEAGSGFVEVAHGVLPVPAPATSEILRGIPVHLGGASFETVTPTGAAILAATVTRWTDTPAFAIEATGYGLGHHPGDQRPNMLRLFLATTCHEPLPEEILEELVCTLDDMDPQWYDWLTERLFEEGALDVTLTPVIMKKGRPGTQVSVLCTPPDAERLGDVLLRESTTIGYRRNEVSRVALPRTFSEVETPLGKVRVKESFSGEEVITRKAEYEDCRRIAREKGLPLRKVCEEVERYLHEHKK